LRSVLLGLLSVVLITGTSYAWRGTIAPREVAQPVDGAPAIKKAQLVGDHQRAILYEEDPTSPTGNRFSGEVAWYTQTETDGTGHAPELSVRADVEVPERHLSATMSVRRNTDRSLPASHTIELIFTIPADYPFGSISSVPRIMMKQSEERRGTVLAGLTVKVTPTFFLVGLSSDNAAQNIKLLKEFPWFDIPIVYTDGHRAILAVEKGPSGEGAFAEAFQAWRQ
jgi:hypothetical protein